MVPVLRLYALIADGERGALVGPAGDIVWMCMPTWHGEALFTSLLGGAGVYAVTPLEEFVWGGYYEAGSLIWRSRWVLTGGSVVECREALAFPGKRERALLLRRVMAQKGEARLRVHLDLRASYGRRRFRDLKLSESGSWKARADGLHARWTGGSEARVGENKELLLELTLSEGDRHDFLLELATTPFDSPPPDIETLWHSTQRKWEIDVPQLSGCIGKRDARHAYAVLRGLTSSNGGMAAAITTSLPERANAGRNYDYRYAWIRDQSFAGHAIAAAGRHPLLENAVRFVRDRLLDDGPDLHPVYTVDGKKVPPEKALDHLPGYPGGKTIVVGNRAGEQFQLDAFGEALLLFAAAARCDSLDLEGRRAAQLAAAAIESRWQEKGAGIWETREHHWTHSRLICVAGLRNAAKEVASRELAPRWLALSETILADTSATSIHRTGRWQRSPDDKRVDASLLLPALRHAIEKDDPRNLATLQAIEQELVRDKYCYRFKSSLPLNEAEGAFLISGYWLALTYLQNGRPVEAARWFERSRASCGPPGLFAEEYDVVQRELRGNLPQAFVHALLIECAVQLGKELEKNTFSPPAAM